MYKPRSQLDVRKYFFLIMVIDEWNSLPMSVIHSNTVNIFRQNLTVYLGIEDIYKLLASFLLSHLSLGGLLSWVEWYYLLDCPALRHTPTTLVLNDLCNCTILVYYCLCCVIFYVFIHARLMCDFSKSMSMSISSIVFLL